MLNELIIGL